MNRTSGIYAVTQIPRLYAAFQNLLAGDAARVRLADEFLKVQPGERVLDIACGSAAILPFLGQVDYTGIDSNPKHIAHATRVHGDRGTFMAMTSSETGSLPKHAFDVVLCIGVLHHLDDTQLSELAMLAADRLRAGGRLVAIDPTFIDGQNPIARFLAKRDSGQHVRAPQEYGRALESSFSHVETAICHDLLRVPYTHCITTARGKRTGSAAS